MDRGEGVHNILTVRVYAAHMGGDIKSQSLKMHERFKHHDGTLKIVQENNYGLFKS